MIQVNDVIREVHHALCTEITYIPSPAKKLLLAQTMADHHDHEGTTELSDGDTEPATQLCIPPTQRVDVVEEVRCMVCSVNLSAKSILERELHLNACLDAASLDTRYDCPTCGKELTDYNEQRRLAHVNLCLDRISDLAAATTYRPTETVANHSAAERPVESRVAEPRDDVYACKICGQQLDLHGVEAISRHVKQCGQRFGLRASDLSTTKDPDHIDGGHGTQDQSDERPNAFARMMASASSALAASRTTVRNTVSALAPSNAFDILMKSSKTEAVVQATSSANSNSARSFWHTSTNARSAKRPRTTPSTSTGSTFTPSRRYGCPDFKRIIGTHPPFIVDGFRYASKTLSNVYFLTHFHSDHYTGLQKDFDCGIIYCNHVRAALVVQELGIDAKYVHPVPMNTAVDIRGVQVTFMDANHCPGATIILFRLRSGAAYLHTGDFRFHPKMWEYAPLQPYVPDLTKPDAPSSRRIDGVYLDTTYADPKYTFPTQEASIQHALTLVDRHVAVGDKVLFLFGSYSIGKERLFMEVAVKHGRKVCVSKAKLKMIQTYGWPESQMKLLTTEPAATNLHVVPMQELKLDHLVALQHKHRLRFHQIVAFRPTGWTFSRNNSTMASCQSDPSGNIRIYGVPYSEHSSFAELCEFIRVMNPQAIIPTVNCHSERSVRKQIDLIRQSAFHSIASMFHPQQGTTDTTNADDDSSLRPTGQ